MILLAAGTLLIEEIKKISYGWYKNSAVGSHEKKNEAYMIYHHYIELINKMYQKTAV